MTAVERRRMTDKRHHILIYMNFVAVSGSGAAQTHAHAASVAVARRSRRARSAQYFLLRLGERLAGDIELDALQRYAHLGCRTGNPRRAARDRRDVAIFSSLPLTLGPAYDRL